MSMRRRWATEALLGKPAVPPSGFGRRDAYPTLEPPIELELDFAVEEAAVFVADREDAGDAEAGGVEHQRLQADRAVEYVEPRIARIEHNRIAGDSAGDAVGVGHARRIVQLADDGQAGPTLGIGIAIDPVTAAES